MLSDDLQENLERAPTEARSAALAVLLGLAQEVGSDHEEARAYHDEIERLHREVSVAATTARAEWMRMTMQGGPGEHRKAAERLASFRVEISDARQEIVRYRRLLMASLERVRENLRRIREISIEHGLMTPTKRVATDAAEVIEALTESDYDPPAVAGGEGGRIGSEQSEASLLRRSPRARLVFEGKRRCARSGRHTPSMSDRRARTSDPR